MKERPIIFSAESIKAILEGKKTQTRRVIKPQPPETATDVFFWWHGDIPKDQCAGSGCYFWYPRGLGFTKSQYGEPGDRLWVRETWRTEELPTGLDGIRDKADNEFRPIDETIAAAMAWVLVAKPDETKWRSPIFMPRWASRITLEILSIRVERLQEISPSDAVSEGIERVNTHTYWAWRDYTGNGQSLSALMSFQSLWNTINGRRDYSWDSNPWVWSVEFKRLDPEED